MAITNKKIQFFNTDLTTYLAHQSSVYDGSLFFINDLSTASSPSRTGGRIYNGPNLVANVGFEEFTVADATGTSGTYITGITPTAAQAEDGTLVLGLEVTRQTPPAAQNNYANVKIAAASSGVSNQAGVSSTTTVGPNATNDTLTFTPGNKWVTLYGTGNGDSIKITHLVGTISGGSANTLYGPTAAVTQPDGTPQTINIPQIKVDEAGHVTQVNHYTLTIKDTSAAKGYFGTKSGNDVSLHIGPEATASRDGMNGHGVQFREGTDVSIDRVNDYTLTINHATKTATAGTDTAMTIKPGESKSFTHVSNLGTIDNGHITSTYKTQQVTVDLTGLSNAVHWKGSVSSLPSRPSGGWSDYAAGDVIAVGGKEYILDNESSTGTTGWREFGDEGNWVPKTRKVTGDGTYLSESPTGGALSSDVTISHKALLTTGTANTAYGSATKVPQIKVDAAGHVTSVTSVDITNSRDPGYGKITPANSPSVTDSIEGNTTQIAATDYNEAFTFKAGNKWLVVAGTNSGTAGSDRIDIVHSAPGAASATADTSSFGNGGTFKAVTGITTDAAQHVTGFTLTTFTAPQITNTDHAYLYLGKDVNPTSTLTSGFTSNNTGAFINVKSGNDTTSALGDNHNIKIVGAKDISVDNTGKGIITVQHTNAAITADTTDGFKTFKVDAYGHITGYTAKTVATFNVKVSQADSGQGTSTTPTTLSTHTDFGTTPADLTFTRPDTSTIAGTGLCIQGGNGESWFDFAPAWQTL